MPKTPSKKRAKRCPMCKLLPVKPGENVFKDLPLKVPKLFKNEYPPTKPLKFLSVGNEAQLCGHCQRPAAWSPHYARNKAARRTWISIIDQHLNPKHPVTRLW
jgi:hypothetical protein